MSRIRVPAALAALLLALALAGCGDDDSTTTTGTDGATTTQQGGGEGDRDAPGQGSGKQDGGSRQGGSGAGDPSREVPFRQPGGPAPTSSASLPNEGEESATPGVPLAKGGDNSIQTFGAEAPAEERVQATRVFQAYLDARAAGEYALACSYMSAPIKEQLIAFGGQARGQAPPDCTQVMRAFTEGVPEQALRSAADINVLSMRVEGNQAFLLYRDGENLPFAVPMNEEGGNWKVAAPAGSALFLGA